MAAQVSVHAAEETLTRDLPRVLEDYAEAFARLPELLRLLEERVIGVPTLPAGRPRHEATK